MATYTVTVVGTGIHGFKRWLKAGLRSYGLRVIDAYEHTKTKVSRCTSAQAVRKTKQARRQETTMDMRKYSGNTFIKVGDVRDGPRRVVIEDVAEGKYGKPDLHFDDGTKLSVNATNNRTLMLAYGDESEDWIGKEIELYLGELKYNGDMQEAVLVKPISPPLDHGRLPPPSGNKKMPPPKQKPDGGG